MANGRTCDRCGALWFQDGEGWQHWWTRANGNHVEGSKPGKQSELDLAGLVCNVVNDPACINPCKGREGGDTWAKRMERISQPFGAEA